MNLDGFWERLMWKDAVARDMQQRAREARVDFGVVISGEVIDRMHRAYLAALTRIPGGVIDYTRAPSDNGNTLGVITPAAAVVVSDMSDRLNIPLSHVLVWAASFYNQYKAGNVPHEKYDPAGYESAEEARKTFPSETTGSRFAEGVGVAIGKGVESTFNKILIGAVVVGIAYTAFANMPQFAAAARRK
jgi:hypothetical protein